MSPSPGQVQALAARVFRFNRRPIAPGVFDLKHQAIEQALATTVFHLNHHGIELAPAPRVVHLNRHDSAPGIFHLNHHIVRPSLAPERFFSELG